MSGIVAGAIVGAFIGAGSSLHNKSKYNRNLIKAFKEQMKYAQMTYNYNQAQLDQQSSSLYDSAVSNLFTLSLNAYQNNSTVEAALGETGYEGRNKDAISRTIEGQVLRQKTATKEAYEVDLSNIWGQKDALYIDMKHSVDQARSTLKSQFKGGGRWFMNEFIWDVAQGAALGAAGGAFGGAVAGAGSGATSGTASGALGGGSGLTASGGGITGLTAPVSGSALGSAGTASLGSTLGYSAGAYGLSSSMSSSATTAASAGSSGSMLSNTGNWFNQVYANYNSLTENSGLYKMLWNINDYGNQYRTRNRNSGYGGYYY